MENWFYFNGYLRMNLKILMWYVLKYAFSNIHNSKTICHIKKRRKKVEINYNHNHRVSIFNFLSFAFKNVVILVFIQIHILSYLYYMFWWQFRIYDTFSIHSNGSLILRMCLVWLLLHFSPNWKEYQNNKINKTKPNRRTIFTMISSTILC